MTTASDRPTDVEESDAQLDDAEPTAVEQLHELGRYRLCFELAAGGMATVYLARAEGPEGFEKLVALKCVHPHLVRRKRFAEMFLDEARIAARISHPNVCAVFDFGCTDGRYFIAMEYLVGETVARIMTVMGKRPDMLQSPPTSATPRGSSPMHAKGCTPRTS